MKKVLTIGGSGVLGRAIVSKFVPDNFCANIDLVPNVNASLNIPVTDSTSMIKNLGAIRE